MLKKSSSFVLASLRGSTYRSVRLTSSLAAALLDSLFEYPAWCTPVIPDVQISEIPAYPQSSSATCQRSASRSRSTNRQPYRVRHKRGAPPQLSLCVVCLQVGLPYNSQAPPKSDHRSRRDSLEAPTVPTSGRTPAYLRAAVISSTPVHARCKPRPDKALVGHAHDGKAPGHTSNTGDGGKEKV